MTYTIGVQNAASGDFGTVTVSHSFDVARTTFTHASSEHNDVIAIAQAFSDKELGAQIARDVIGGSLVSEAVESALATDRFPESRQIVAVTRHGDIGAWTGKDCVQICGDFVQTEDRVVVAGNMLASSDLVEKVAHVAHLQDPSTPVGERLLDLVGVASIAGGDARGDRSAVLAVVHAGDAQVLRVPYSLDPVAELAQQAKLLATSTAISACYGWLFAGEDSGYTPESLRTGLMAIDRPDHPMADEVKWWIELIDDHVGMQHSPRSERREKAFKRLHNSLHSTRGGCST